jgi:hypothetical protein
MSSTTSGETTTVTGTRAFVDAMIAHNSEVRAEIEQASAGLATAGITGPVLDGLHELAGHYDGARGHWDSLGAALKQHEALGEQARATHGAATDMTFYTDDSVKDPMTTSADSTVPAADVAGGGDALPDTAGITDGEHWHASDVLTAGDGKVCLGLCKYPDSDAYVVVATKPADQPWDPDGTANGIDPPLSPQEAGQFADTLDELVDLAQSGAATPTPTKLDKVAEQVRGLLGDSGVTIVGDEGEIEVSAEDIRKLLDAAAPEPTVATRHKVTSKACEKEDGFDTGTVWAQLDTSGPEPVIAVTSTEGKEQPEDYPEGYTTTRLSLPEARELASKVRRLAQTTPDAAAPDTASPDTASADTAGQSSSPGRSDAEADVEQVRQTYARLAAEPGDYVALTDIRDAVPIKDRERVDRALRQLLTDDEVRLEPEPFGHRIGTREKQAAVHIGGEDRHKLSIDSSPGTSVAPTPAAPAPAPAPAGGATPAGPRRVSSSHGKKFEYDPGTGATAVIESDGWRAVVPPSSPTGIATRLLYWNAEIKDGRGDDATDAAARELLAGLSAAELREVADNIGASAPGARTKAQLTDAIVNMAVSSPRKYRGLRRW